MRRISFKTAQLAAEKGYNEDCDRAYSWKGKLEAPYYGSTFKNGAENGDSVYAAPYQAELQQWLREEHGVSVLVELDVTLSYYWIITPLHPEAPIQEFKMSQEVWCGDYEGCLESGLQAALKMI